MAWRLFFPCTLRTQPLGHIVDAMELVALGKMNGRNGSLGYAEGTEKAKDCMIYRKNIEDIR